jgi:hypothetical protein
MVIHPRATASRVVTGFSLTSTIRTSPDGVTWDKRERPPGARLDFVTAALGIEVSLREKE